MDESANDPQEQSPATPGQQLALDLVRDALSTVNASNASLDARTLRLVSLSTAIAAVSGAAKLLPETFQIDAPAVLVIGVMGCSLWVAWLALDAIKPRSRPHPGMNPTDRLSADYMQPTPYDATNRAISQFAYASETVVAINTDKADCVRKMLRTISFQMALLTIAVTWQWIEPFWNDLMP